MQRQYENNWRIRRTAVISTLVGCAAGMAYILFLGEDTVLNQTAFTSLAMLFGSTLFAYLGWATYDDRSVVNRLGKDAFCLRRPDAPEDYPADIAPPEGYAQ